MMQAGRHASLQRKPDGFSGQLSKEASIEIAKPNVIQPAMVQPPGGTGSDAANSRKPACILGERNPRVGEPASALRTIFRVGPTERMQCERIPAFAGLGRLNSKPYGEVFLVFYSFLVTSPVIRGSCGLCLTCKLAMFNDYDKQFG